MINALVRATVWYTCYIDGEEEEKVRKYAEENDCELAEAVTALYEEVCNTGDGISLYANSVESDFATEEVESAEIDDD